MIVGTAGHIDHGKTSLVYALTGVDTDRLKEEKIRGISIELGYAYSPLDNGEMLGFVDVPGHERLVHTMAAGAGGIDFALLVIAADDGVMPQTREHMAILEMLGVTRGAVALTKIDRVDPARAQEAGAQAAAFIERSALREVSIFPLNAAARDDPGVAALRAHLRGIAAAWPARFAGGLFRLAVDRVFTLPGRGTVAAGTVQAGQVRVGDTVSVMPGGIAARVRSIHAQSRDTDTGSAGQRCALNLAGIEKAQIRRGDWLADPRSLAVSTRLDVDLRWLEPQKIADRSALHVHVGTAHRGARRAAAGRPIVRRREYARATRVRCTGVHGCGRSLHRARFAGQAYHRWRRDHRPLCTPEAPRQRCALRILGRDPTAVGGGGPGSAAAKRPARRGDARPGATLRARAGANQPAGADSHRRDTQRAICVSRIELVRFARTCPANAARFSPGVSRRARARSRALAPHGCA
jgi:small GTP-binding protein